MTISIGAGGRPGSGLGQAGDGGSTRVTNSDGYTRTARGGQRGNQVGGSGWSGGGSYRRKRDTFWAGGRVGPGLGQADNGESTTVKNSDGTTVTSLGGHRGDSTGGSRLSGKGSHRGGAGGSNGSNGGDGWFYNGGSGQGTRLPYIEGVTLVPGAGGARECSGCIGGGGGGGIIINGGGTRGQYEAQGYGSGGGDYGKWGYRGAVIIYV